MFHRNVVIPHARGVTVVVVVVVVVFVVHAVGERSKRLEEIRLRRQQQREALLQGANVHTASERASQVSTGGVVYGWSILCTLCRPKCLHQGYCVGLFCTGGIVLSCTGSAQGCDVGLSCTGGVVLR